MTSAFFGRDVDNMDEYRQQCRQLAPLIEWQVANIDARKHSRDEITRWHEYRPEFQKKLEAIMHSGKMRGKLQKKMFVDLRSQVQVNNNSGYCRWMRAVYKELPPDVEKVITKHGNILFSNHKLKKTSCKDPRTVCYEVPWPPL